MAHTAHTSRHLKSAALLSLTSVLLAACGGGGDAGAIAPAATSLGAPSVRPAGLSGLVPAAPAAGETLHADAAALRPLRNEALWVYRGTRNAGSRKLVYASFRQTVSATSGFSERISSPLEGASGVQGVSISGGTVRVQGSVELPAGAAAAELVELRSPVRRDDQVTLVDQSGVALKTDVDGDGQIDHMDIGSYSRVAGNDEVELPELGRTLQALRVDATTVSRVTPSSRGKADPAQTVVVSSWYAPGIGLVRRTTTAPSTDGIGALDTDERLQYWDGIDKGIGLVPSAPVAAASGTRALGPWLEAPYSAVRNGDRAFVLSAKGGLSQRPELGVVLSVMDNRGQVLSSVEHQDLGLDSTSRPEIMPLGDGAAMVLTEMGVYSDPYVLENLRLVRFDAQGYRTRSHWLAAGALPGTLKAASDGQNVWVTWVEQGLALGSSRVMLQAFDANGSPRARPQILDSRATGLVPTGTAVAAAAGRALVTWQVPGSAGVEYRQALVQGAGTAAVATLESGAPPVDGGHAQPVPRISDSLAALTWYAPLTPASGDAGPAVAPRGVVLDATARARRATAGAADNEALRLPAHDAQRSAMQADADSLLFSTVGSARLSADEVADDRYVEFAALQPASGALAAATVRLHRYRDRTPAANLDGAPAAINHILAFEDRWLILGQAGTRMTAAVLHKR